MIVIYSHIKSAVIHSIWTLPLLYDFLFY